MFVPTDLYLVQGSTQVVNNWTSNVVKHHSGSFYNWEEDNLPIYELEDRTDHMWERMGYPVRDGFSGIAGISLVVSADAFNPGGIASAVTTDSSGILFKTVSAAVNILPQVISFPVVIEVATFGELGELKLNNLKFAKNGGLEIVNRTFAKMFSASSIFSGTSPFNLCSVDIDNTLAAASALALSAIVTSAANDARWNANVVCYYTQCPFTSSNNRLTKDSDIYFGAGVATTFDLGSGEFELGSGYTDNTSEVYDVSTAHSVSNQLLLRDAAATGPGARVAGFVYGNRFSKVSIKNCGGPIYIRNFAVDGKNHTTPNENIGWDIVNSNLLLENCFATRCNQQGFRFINSDVLITRGIASFRNYTISSTIRMPYQSVGIQALGSNILVSGNSLYGSGVDNIFQCSYNKVGLELVDSTLRGGDSRNNAASLARTHTTRVSFLQTFFNTTGILAQNSDISYDGRIDSFNNEVGIELKSSNFNTAELETFANQYEGIKSDNSLILLNKDLYQFPTTTLDSNNFQQYVFAANGQHLNLKNSVTRHPQVSSIPTRFGKMLFASSHGVNTVSAQKTTIPAVYVENSVVELVHPVIKTAISLNNFVNNEPVYGACVAARKGSAVKLRGSRNGVGLYLGYPGLNEHKHVSVLYAGDQSTIEVMGPTVIAQANICALAEDESTIKFTPHTNNENIDVSGWELTHIGNHTKVELFATRACLVANRKSNIIMENLGDYGARWPLTQTSAADFNQGNDFTTSAYVSAGYMQFYPNGQDDDSINASAQRYSLEANGGSIPFEGAAAGLGLTRYLILDYWAAGAATNIEKYSNGGMCVRAIGGSHIKAKNVHYPCGWSNASGVVYDVSGGTSQQLRIWNIADDSTADISYCSISGVYPNLAPYNGPSAFYNNGTGIATCAVATTPDFGVTSLLDFYGASGTTAGTNYGPFRLYVSPLGPAKMLYYVSSTNGNPVAYGAPYQSWAQGYNPSGPVSATQVIREMGYHVQGGVSGFYHTSAMLDANSRNRIKMDESAMNSFGNAKNGVVGKAGRIPILSIYKATTDAGGESYTTNLTGAGRGFMSATIFDLSRRN